MSQQEAQAALLRQAEKRKRKQRAKKYRAQQAKAARAGLERSPRTQPQRGRAQERACYRSGSPPGPPTFGRHAPMGYGRHIVVRRGETWRLRQAIKLAREAMSRGEHKWGHTRPTSDEVPMDQERRPRPLEPDAQVPDRDQEQERPEEQSKPRQPQQALVPVRDQSRKDKAE